MDNFQIRLRAALKAGKCKALDAARECHLAPGTMHNWVSRPHVLRRSTAEKLGKCAIKHINEQIQVKCNEINELRRMGVMLKEAYKEVYGEDEPTQ